VNDIPQNERAKTDLAVQVANVAAQVSAALQSGDQEARDELGAKLTLARERLEQGDSPPGLLSFVDVMRGLLDGQDVYESAQELPVSYRAVYDQIVEEQEMERSGVDLTVGQVLDEVTTNVLLAMQHGSFDQRRKMADTLLVMEQECSGRPDLAALIDFLSASRMLLKGGDLLGITEQLVEPYRGRWNEMLSTIEN
jgi:hypothetical protein